jgi:hypothetical protein
LAIPNAKIDELGEEVLNERSEFRNVTPQPIDNQKLKTAHRNGLLIEGLKA